MHRLSLVDRMAEVGPPPCSRGCAWISYCGRKAVCCELFRDYVKHGGDHRHPWRGERPKLRITIDLDC